MSTIHEVLRDLLLLPGATYSCAAVRASGELVAEAGAAPVDPAVVVRWARSAVEFLADADDDLDDLMVTSRRSYRLVRPVSGADGAALLLHLCLDRTRANLAVARRALAGARLAAAADLPQAPVPAPPPAVELRALVPLPRRVPSAIPPPAGRIPPSRAPRWPAPPSPGRSAHAAPGAPAVPLQRDPSGPPAPFSQVPSAPAAGVTRWADDVGTLQRLLAGLRAMR